MGQVKAGKLRILAILGEKRVSSLPEVPTIAEAGVPEATGQSWNAMVTRAKTPTEIIRRINTDLVTILKRADIAERLALVGFVTLGGTPEDLAAVMRADLAKWGKVIRTNNIKPE